MRNTDILNVENELSHTCTLVTPMRWLSISQYKFPTFTNLKAVFYLHLYQRKSNALTTEQESDSLAQWLNRDKAGREF